MQIFPTRARLWRWAEWSAVAVALSWCFVWTWAVILQRPRGEGVLSSRAAQTKTRGATQGGIRS
jgi:hypothetical protein